MQSRRNLFAVLAGLLLLAAIVVVLAYSKLRSKPVGSEPAAAPPPAVDATTTVELDDEFLDLNKWTTPPPPSGWNIDPNDGQGRLVIEGQPLVGTAKDIVYADFEMSFNLKLLNQGGAAWALRVDKEARNYYLFYLPGPEGKYPNRFLSYIVRDGVIDVKTQRSTEIIARLKVGEQYQIDIEAVQNKIMHEITPAGTGIKSVLQEFVDPNNSYPRGGIGFRTVGNEKFSVDDLFARPWSMQTSQS